MSSEHCSRCVTRSHDALFSHVHMFESHCNFPVKIILFGRRVRVITHRWRQRVKIAKKCAMSRQVVTDVLVTFWRPLQLRYLSKSTRPMETVLIMFVPYKNRNAFKHCLGRDLRGDWEGKLRPRQKRPRFCKLSSFGRLRLEIHAIESYCIPCLWLTRLVIVIKFDDEGRIRELCPAHDVIRASVL